MSEHIGTSASEHIGVYARISEDLAAAKLRDPAARGGLEIAVLYPGLHAIWAHRVWHALWTRDLRFVARRGVAELRRGDVLPGPGEESDALVGHLVSASGSRRCS